MAFQNKNLSVIVYANGFTLWQYKTEDTMQELLSGYFTTVADLMAVGDIIIINAGNENGIRAITKIENKHVELGNLQ